MQKFDELMEIVRKLRRECPWDREQTFETIKPYLVEEVYEALQAIDDKDYGKLAEELGDMLLHIVMLSVFAEQAKKFKIDDVIDSISAKMIRRHPHVFAKGRAKTKEEVWRKWEKIKREEASGQGLVARGKRGMLDSIPRSLPALYRADKVQKRAARVGFDWDKVAGAWAHEVRDLISNDKCQMSNECINNLKEEIGDLLFAVTNVARKLNLSAEEALQQANNKFIKRFARIEKALQKKKLTLPQMEALWRQAKKRA